MACTQPNKFIAIIRDGYSDYLVLKKFVSSIFECHKSLRLEDDVFFDLDSLTIHDIMTRYVDGASKNNDYTLHSSDAIQLRKDISSVLFTALKKCEKDMGSWLSHKDIIILYTDAESVLKAKHNYFKEWAYTLNGVLWMAIEEFYNTMTEHQYDYENLPLILPLTLFPSSEILVAACMFDFDKENYRSFRAKPTLKQKVYGTDNIPKAIIDGNLTEVLATYVVPDSPKEIYREIPEIRKMIQILSFDP